VTTLALLAWPFVTLILVLRLPFPQAILFSLIGGYLLLPTQGGIDLPILPPLTKVTIPALTLLLLGLLVYSQRRAGGSHAAEMAQDLPGWLPRSPVAILGLALVFVGAQMTALTNGDPLVYGPTVLRGMAIYDGFSIALLDYTALIPLILGRKFFAHPDRHRLLLQTLVAAALCLSLLALYEIRMSPQLNNMVYGYFPHDWQQHKRAGGWRPIVFMNHGLQLALLFGCAVIAAIGLSRVVPKHHRSRYLLAGGWLLVTLFLSNSLGAFVIAVLVLLVALLAPVRVQMIFAAAVAASVLIFPMLRSADVVPTERLVSWAAAIEQDRANSLRFRFNNEDILLAHAAERPLFGWGLFGRSRVFTEEGVDDVVTDGAWIVALGKGGWVGYLTSFGFMALPLIFLAVSRRTGVIHPATAILCLVVAASLIDLIPNGFLSPITMLAAGALWGRWELRDHVFSSVTDGAIPEPALGPRFSRARPAGRDPAAGVPTHQQNPQPPRPVYTRQTTQHQRLRKTD
jgi:hypothetical protein